MTTKSLDGFVAQREELLEEASLLHQKIKDIERLIESQKRSQLRTLIGTSVRFCGSTHNRQAWQWLNGAVGTLRNVNRSRCDVDFDGRLVRLRILDVAPTDSDIDATVAKLLRQEASTNCGCFLISTDRF